jgi:hypothetical protein
MIRNWTLILEQFAVHFSYGTGLDRGLPRRADRDDISRLQRFSIDAHILRRHVHKILGSKLEPILDMVVRWNSTYSMLERALRLKKVLQDLTTSELKDFDLEDEWKSAEDISETKPRHHTSNDAIQRPIWSPPTREEYETPLPPHTFPPSVHIFPSNSPLPFPRFVQRLPEGNSTLPVISVASHSKTLILTKVEDFIKMFPAVNDKEGLKEHLQQIIGRSKNSKKMMTQEEWAKLNFDGPQQGKHVFWGTKIFSYYFNDILL